ncbi:unnamed protein product [Gongylonema pulchrum]|uniref:7TM_GPCR_Srx domain-containing protein n=1 Tax=Gongylonema pulchrum TaxID=637853 RepID=A0A183DR45_9BILA|nr:unnamed protein product [Gongylonema pulchrum]
MIVGAIKFQLILFFAIAIPSAFSLVWLTPYATYGFDAELLMWEYDSPDFMPSYDRLTTLATSILATLCYVLVLIFVLRKSWSSRSKVSDNSRRRDTLLTLQVVINGGYTVCVSTYFMFLRPYYVPYTVIFNALDIVLCVLWNGKSPIMHLIFNGYIRTKFLENIQNQKVVSLVPDVTSCSQHKTPKSSSFVRTPANDLSPRRTKVASSSSLGCSRDGHLFKQTFLVTAKSFISINR